MDEHNEHNSSKMSEMKSEIKETTGLQSPSGSGAANPEAGIASVPHWMVIFSWPGLVINIILLVVKGKESAYFRTNVIEAINVGIWRVILDIITIVMAVIVILLLPAWILGCLVFLYCTVFGIIAGIYTIQAKTDTPSYRYALPFRFIK